MTLPFATTTVKAVAADNAISQLKAIREEVIKADFEVKKSIGEIEEFVGPDRKLNEICCHVRDKITYLQQQVQDMQELLEVLSRRRDEVSEFMNAVKHYKQETVNNNRRLRSAVLNCVQNRERHERQLLLTSSPSPPGGDDSGIRQRHIVRGDSVDDDDHIANTKKLNRGLEGLLTQMDAEVKKSEQALNMLLGSSEMLSDTNTEFQTMDAHVKKSGKLLSKYQRRDLSDRVLFYLSFFMFFAVVLYIIRKRFISIFW
ncbi:unnamed protein product [Soboliphyme baturini]|uniref:Vesicle transport protein SEC20 n=1 Tax=Soboliphyme baturini TaxID=241478 RepID=A0A183J4Q5_9BILA|nr:unnamed protein product [Soboliphyme baturini]